MSFKKYQKVEKSSVLSKDGHKHVEGALRKLGKRSVSELDEDERKNLTNSLDKSSKS